MKIVILEADSLGQDMVFTPFEALGEVVIYPTTTADEMEEKTKDADVIVANKVPICESTIGKARNLKLVCLTATGKTELLRQLRKIRRICKRHLLLSLRSEFLRAGWKNLGNYRSWRNWKQGGADCQGIWLPYYLLFRFREEIQYRI